MGYYINQDSKGKHLGTQYSEKLQRLKNDGAEEIPVPTEWEEGLVVVVDNGWMAAAGYAFDKEELEHFKDAGKRSTTWLKYEHAAELSGYKNREKG